MKSILSENTEYFKDVVLWCNNTFGKEGDHWEIKIRKSESAYQKRINVIKIGSHKIGDLCCVKYIQFKNRSAYTLYKMTHII